MKRRAPASSLTPDQRMIFALLLAAQAATVAPLLVELPLWVPGITLFLIGLRALFLWRNRPTPRSWVLVLLGIGAAAAVLAQFHSLNGRDAGVSMLLFAAALKSFEIRSRRDLIVVIYLAYLLAVAHFLFDQSIPWVLYALALIVFVTMLLTRLHAGPQPPGWRSLGYVGLLRILAAIPLTLLLFALFPRIEGPLWGRPAQSQNAVTGITNQLTPGSIARLATSQAVAFRATFTGAPPAHDARYWRVYVMDHFNGRRWVQSPSARPHPGNLQPTGQIRHYSLLMQASDRHAIPALDMPLQAPARARLEAGHVLRANNLIDGTREFALSAASHYVLDSTLAPGARRAALQLPPGVALQARALAERWRAADPAPQAIVNRALAYFHDHAFYYTLRPPPLHGDITDDFLFKVRRGFCEQYASAFAVLMRAAGIPTRIVAGYAGGEWNPVLHYLLVRQANAHAWVEVWLQGRGWVRIDPTSAVAASRVQRSAANSPGVATIGEGLHIGFVQHWFNTLSMSWDSVEYFWNLTIVAFGPQQQRAFLQRIGLQSGGIAQALYIAIGIAVLMLLGLGIDLLRRSAAPADAPTRLYRRHLRRLARSGLRPAPSEGALDFAERVAAQLPQEAEHARRIAALYTQARYAGGDTKRQTHRLRQLMQAVRETRKSD
ncbi:transglutaminase TgpA family protein [Acidihalobacter ferrooxydans]|uniref:Transglutaminase-like domain-containing protein n=1 Tax=Acidihalobacter ferrooxydans TaxID=1765967 RepID=A0A1P8UFY7_9GAMM|nr:DUF3488 and transglutaminase-like domain-containing protein [Acidihalobacter ferrooxydans]APZ42684.1 hypothetical protein BW247_05875 [Acidihalobacter ferrooxydans]